MTDRSETLTRPTENETPTLSTGVGQPIGAKSPKLPLERASLIIKPIQWKAKLV